MDPEARIHMWLLIWSRNVCRRLPTARSPTLYLTCPCVSRCLLHPLISLAKVIMNSGLDLVSAWHPHPRPSYPKCWNLPMFWVGFNPQTQYLGVCQPTTCWSKKHATSATLNDFLNSTNVLDSTFYWIKKNWSQLFGQAFSLGLIQSSYVKSTTSLDSVAIVD